jgi:hypothetical protein
MYWWVMGSTSLTKMGYTQNRQVALKNPIAKAHNFEEL